MRKIMIVASAILALAITSFPAFAADQTAKIGVVDVQGLLEKSPQIEQIRQDLRKQFQSREEKLVAQQKQLQGDMDKLSKEGAVMKADDKTALQKKIAKEQQDLQNAQASFQQDFMNAQNKQLGNFLDKVRDAITAVAKKDGYTMILSKAAVAYSADDLDITQEVLKKLK